MNRILIATDFSPHAEAALAHAVEFAKAFDAELHVLNVQVPYGPTSPLLDRYPHEEEAHRALRDLEVGVTQAVRTLVRGVAAAPTILTYADDHDVDLLVMGSHGRRGLRRVLLGSVTEEVLRAGRRPVLTVHQERFGNEETPRYGRILVPVDFSSRTPGQLEIAADLAKRFGGELDIVHVVDPPIVPELYMPVGALAIDMRQTMEKTIERVEELAGPLRDDLEVRTDVLVGRAVRELLDRAKTAELLVMPTRGNTGFDRMMLGSVTEGVLRRATCPVLALKPNPDRVPDGVPDGVDAHHSLFAGAAAI